MVALLCLYDNLALLFEPRTHQRNALYSPASQTQDARQAKEVKLGDRRYIVCRNLVEAAQAARTREADLAPST